MRNFSYYEAKKFLEDISQKGIDIDQFDLQEFYDAKELAELLDVSDSTANNWLNGRTEISKLGKQALSYQLMHDLIHTYKNIPQSNIVVKKQDIYEIYAKNANEEYELLATTTNPKLARTIKEIQQVYAILNKYKNLISEKLETIETSRYEDYCESYYRTNLNNLIDLIHYIQDGVTYSEKFESLLQTPIDFNFNAKKFEDTAELKTDNNDVFSEFISPISKSYKGQINTKKIPEGTLIRKNVVKGSKVGKYELKKIGEYIVNMENGEKYPSINAASTKILGYEVNVKENWYFYDNSNNEWKKCKYLVEDEYCY